MITLATTGLTPSSNSGMVTTFRSEKFVIPKASLDAVIGARSFFTIGHDVSEDLNDFIDHVNAVTSGIKNASYRFVCDNGYRQNGGTNEYYWKSTVSIRQFFHDICEAETDYTYVTLKGNLCQNTGASYLVMALYDCNWAINIPTSLAYDDDFYVNFDEVTKKIVSIGDDAGGKKVHLTISFKWDAELTTLAYKDNGGQTHLYINQGTGLFPGIYAYASDYSLYNYGFGETGSTMSAKYCEFWDNGNYNSTVQLYAAPPKDSSKPELDVKIIQDSTFYKEPVVYAMM